VNGSGGLSVPDQVGQVSGNGAEGIPGGTGQFWFSGQRDRIGEKHAEGGSAMSAFRVAAAGMFGAGVSG
jgi:hypothetical protein